MAKSKTKIPLVQPTTQPFNNPFAHLSGGAPSVPEAPAAAVASVVSSAKELTLAGQGKVTVRREKKGRAGKTVTVIAGLVLTPSALEQWAEKLRKALGCGSHVEEGTIVLQGPQVDRAAALLREYGVKQI